MIAIGMLFMIPPTLILIGAIRVKFEELCNPIRKDNFDYSFTCTKVVKTRSIFDNQ